jgi:SagB-type dehydrogenase family enzyme
MIRKSDQALDYHEATKHSELSIRESGHLLDWANRPSPFKVYKNLKAVPLPRDFSLPSEGSLKAIGGIYPKVEGRAVDLHILAQLLFFSAGLTRVVKLNSGPYYMRAASATGALYPIELYVVCGDISGLKAGVFHFNPLDFSLVQLRDGDYRSELGAISDHSVLTAPVTVVLTSLAWRNAWKYGARSYRHWFWDSGVMIANLLATGVSVGLKCGLIMGFVDSEVDRLLCLGERKEATVVLARVGLGPAGSRAKEMRRTSRLSPEVNPVSREVEYPIIWETHQASALKSRDEVKTWVQDRLRFPRSLVTGNEIPLRPMKYSIEAPSLGDVILRRGSARRFARLPISFEQLSTIIDASTGAIPLDFLKPRETLIDVYLIANEVRELRAGAYFYNRRAGCLEQLKVGQFRGISGYLCLEQPLFSDASAVFYLMTNLKSVIGALGNRGYRAAQFEAGVIAGKVYLSAYSLSMGASGSTFYDDAVTEFFSPHAKGKSTMIVVGVGIPAYKAKSGKVLPQMSVS